MSSIVKMKVPGDREYEVELENAVKTVEFIPYTNSTFDPSWKEGRFQYNYKVALWRIKYGTLSEHIRYIWDDMVNHIKPKTYGIDFHYTMKNDTGECLVVFNVTPFKTENDYMYFSLNSWNIIHSENTETTL